MGGGRYAYIQWRRIISVRDLSADYGRGLWGRCPGRLHADRRKHAAAERVHAAADRRAFWRRVRTLHWPVRTGADGPDLYPGQNGVLADSPARGGQEART